jgi:hypothetical protein
MAAFGGAASAGADVVAEEASTTPAAENPMAAFGGDATPVTTPEAFGEEEQGASQEEDPMAAFSGFVGPNDAEQSGTESEPVEAGEMEIITPPDFSGLTPAIDSDDSDDQKEAEHVVESESGGFEGPDPKATADEEGPNKIEEFAEKLQDAKKITPVIDFSAQESPPPSTADETAAGAGFVTPTLAEIYAKQGWHDDAINAYKTLAKTRPAEKEKFEQRVKELEEEKSKGAG